MSQMNELKSDRDNFRTRLEQCEAQMIKEREKEEQEMKLIEERDMEIGACRLRARKHNETEKKLTEDMENMKTELIVANNTRDVMAIQLQEQRTRADVAEEQLKKRFEALDELTKKVKEEMEIWKEESSKLENITQLSTGKEISNVLILFKLLLGRGEELCWILFQNLNG